MQQNVGAHHQHVRKRVHQKHEAYPHPDRLKRIVDKLVYVTGVVTPLMTLPQVLRIWVHKSATDVSFYTWLAYLLVALIWIAYGVLHKAKPIIVLNVGLAIVNSLVVVGVLLYGSLSFAI